MYVKYVTKLQHSTVPSQKNWHGSLKGMELAAAEETLRNVAALGATVNTLLMDDDASTLNRIKLLKANIIKWSDMNHTKKHLGNSLFSLTKHYKQLSKETVKSLMRWFTFAITQNKGKPEDVASAIRNIVPHAFGEHDNCGTWCRFSENPQTFRHNTLPRGQNLSGDQLKNDLSAIFEVFAKNSKKLAPAATTREVESFNNMVAAKAPKRCHYSGSESLSARVSCAAAQKNIGHEYVQEVNRSVGVSPGHISGLIALRRNKKRKQMQEIENSVSFKKRKLQLRAQKKQDNDAKEIREGTSYKSVVALSSDLSSDDISAIPPPVKLVSKLVSQKDFQSVYFDLETTSLGMDADITQISAVHESSHFNQYVVPVKCISAKASEVTGLTCHGDVLMLHGQPVSAVYIHAALTLFISWLSDIGSCILLCHNVKFDAPRLTSHLLQCKLGSPFTNVVHGFSDTLPMFRSLYPNLENHKQPTLVKQILKETYDAHNALADVVALKKLTDQSNITNELILSNTVSSQWYIEHQLNEKSCKCNVQSLDNMVKEKVISKQLASKIGNSGLHFNHLLLAVQRSGFDGLKSVLTEDIDGTVRVTRNTSVIKKLFHYLLKSEE